MFASRRAEILTETTRLRLHRLLPAAAPAGYPGSPPGTVVEPGLGPGSLVPTPRAPRPPGVDRGRPPFDPDPGLPPLDLDRRSTAPPVGGLATTHPATTVGTDPGNDPVRAATGRWTVVGAVPYRRHLHFDHTARVHAPTPVDRADPAGEDPSSEVPDGSPAGASSSRRPTPTGVDRAVPAASADAPGPAGAEAVTADFADVREPACSAPDTADSAGPREARGSEPVAVGSAGSGELAGSARVAADSADPREVLASERVGADLAGDGALVEVVDLDGARQDRPAGAAAVSARPERWYDRSARLLGVRRALLDPGRRGLRALVVVAIVVVVAAGLVAWRLRPVTDPVETPRVPIAAPTATPSASAGNELVISVVGKVRHPGVVRVPAGSRVADAVRAAGGVLPGVDVGLLNQARRLVDGEQIAVGVTPPPDAGGVRVPGGSANPASKVNLNTATADQLDTLPGVGPTLAGRIISFRTEHGGFRSVEQLKQVSGIGDARYADLKDLVTV